MTTATFVYWHKTYPDVLNTNSRQFGLRVGGTPADRQLADSTGVTISDRNFLFAELTGAYWIWKNFPLKDVDFVTLNHYRRYLSIYEHQLFEKPRTEALIGIETREVRRLLRRPIDRRLLRGCDGILPIPQSLDGNTLEGQYLANHPSGPWEELLALLTERHGVNAVDEFRQLETAVFWNMSCLRTSLFIDFSSWIFDLLFALEVRLPVVDTWRVPPYGRTLGFLGERLHSFYFLVLRKDLQISHRPVYFWKDAP